MKASIHQQSRRISQWARTADKMQNRANDEQGMAGEIAETAEKPSAISAGKTGKNLLVFSWSGRSQSHVLQHATGCAAPGAHRQDDRR
jgi:hypothetical protein